MNMHLVRVTKLFLIVAAFAHLNAPENAHAKLEVIVPAYFYPSSGSPWDDLNSAASQVDITAIMNPASGSGTFQNSDYVDAVSDLQAAGGKVLGYVATTYSTKSIAQVQAEIDNYYNWYGVDGIFFDEMSNNGPASKVVYYQTLYNYVKSKDPNDQVVGNPGTNTLEQYLTYPGGTTADQFVISENFGSQYLSYSPSSWVYDYERTNFAHLIHSEASVSNMIDYLQLAVTRNAGSIYITHDVLANPWDTLPVYWTTELSVIEQINNALLPGDFNENGTVDGDDILRISSGFGIESGASKYQGDSNEDGIVNGYDFLQLYRDFGENFFQPTGFAASGVTVPEPSSIYLISICILMHVGKREKNFLNNTTEKN